MRILTKNVEDNLASFLQVKNATEKAVDLYFYGDIVTASWGAWDKVDQYPEQVKDFLVEHEGKELNIYFNSAGGNVFAGLAIYNMLKRHTGKKIAYIDGLAGSIASVLPFACDEVHCPANAYFMVHKPYVLAEGNASELRKIAEDLDAIQVGMMQIYKEALAEGADFAALEAAVEAETWLNGEEAAKYFKITVTQAKEIAACATDYFAQALLPDTLKAKEEPLEDSTKEADINARIALDATVRKLLF